MLSCCHYPDDVDHEMDDDDVDLAEAVVVAILECLASEVVKLALLQWVVLMITTIKMMIPIMMVMNMMVMLVMKVEVMVIMSRMKRISESEDGYYLKKSAVKVCNVDHAAAGLITSHLRLLLPKKNIQSQILQTI